jgi:hypothetical protein
VTEQTDRQTKLRTDEDEEFNMNRLVAWLAMFGSRLLIFRDFPFADKVFLYIDMAAIRQISSIPTGSFDRSISVMKGCFLGLSR